MNHNEFFQSVKTAPPAPCYVFEGAEEFIKRSALDKLRSLILQGGVGDMDEARLTDPAADEVIAAAETLPFLAQRRLVVVRECGMLSGRARDYDEAANARTLAAYFQSPSPSACVVFYVRGKADVRKILYTALKKCAHVVSFDPLDERGLTTWIVRELKRAGKRISNTTCAKLIFTAGNDLTHMAREVDKLIARAGEGEEITAAFIDEICVKTAAARVYDLAGVLLRGESGRAFALCAALLKGGEEPLKLLSLLGMECRRLLATRLLSDKRMTAAAIAREIAAPVFAIQKSMSLARQYDIAQLKRMAWACMDAEYQVKSGRLPLEGALEKTMLQLLRVRAEGKP